MNDRDLASRLASIAADLAQLAADLAVPCPEVSAPPLAPLPAPLPTVPVVPVVQPSTNARFLACVGIVLGHEGGYVNHPDDPGGATNMGITQATLAAYRGRDVSVADVQRLALAEARAIYETRYWLPNRCDHMEPGVDLAVFDFAVNSGGAIKAIQKMLGVKVDGGVGAETLGAMAQYEASDLIVRISQTRMTYLRGLKVFETFGNGLTARVDHTRQVALAMAGSK